MANRVGFRASFTGIRVQHGKYTKKLDEACQNLIKQATKAWMRAVIEAVPVWTGFARGSVAFAHGPYGGLASFLKVAVDLAPRHKHPLWYYHPTRINRIRKIPEKAGIFAHYNFVSERHKHSFNFKDTVVHFILGEFGLVGNTGPWNAMEIGRDAFMQVIREGTLKLPRLGQALIRFKIPVAEASI